MTILSWAISLISAHIYLASFLGGFFGGEETIIVFLTIIVSQKISIIPFFVMFQVGELAMDFIIFYVSTTKAFDFFVKKEFASKGYKQLVYIMNRYSHKNPFVTMLITKFVYGTRMVTLVYMAREKLKFGKFLSYNIVTTLIWMSVITALGIFIGAGVSTVITAVKNVETGIVLLIVAMGLFYLINIRIKKWLLRKQKK